MTRQHRDMKSYWNTPDATMSLGCRDCPDLGLCGGQTIQTGGFDCLEHCCNNPQNCRSVCPKATTFADRIREVGGLSLETAAAARLKPPVQSGYVPLVFHDSARVGNLATRAVAMPLYRFFDQYGDCRYGSRDDVSRGFKVDSGAELFLSGVAQDREVEKWWKLETSGRIKAIGTLRRLGVGIVTTPNFSLIVDRPRWDDLHSMKRIVEVYHEFVSEGQPAALHVNGRAERDFERWADYIVTHPEVTHLAYEFTTGTRKAVRMRQHVLWLISMAEMAGRRLGLIIRGGIQVAGELARHFDVTFIDTSAFEKAQHRFVALIDDGGHLRWEKRNTPVGRPIDDLLAGNIRVSELWMQGILPKLALAA